MMQLGLERYVVVQKCALFFRAQFVSFLHILYLGHRAKRAVETLAVASVLINFHGGLGNQRVLVRNGVLPRNASVTLNYNYY